RGQPATAPRRLLSEDTARLVTLFLSDPMARLPTFPRMGPSEYPFPVAVKTGTSSRYRDALTVAYSTRWVVGVWLGRPDYRPMSRLTAFSSAAGLAQRILGHLHQGQQDGLEDLPFPPPRGHRPVRICALTGKRATRACGQVLLEWFRPGQEPLEDCDARVLAEQSAEKTVWYGDGAPFQVVDYPYTTRWGLTPGEHTFQARLPFARAASEAVRVRVE